MALRQPDLLSDNHESSSPDPLSLSGPLPISSPVRTPHKRPRTPSKLSQTISAHQRSVSPQKTVVLDAPTVDSGTSPWRLRVTVQAEPKDGYSHIPSPPRMGGNVRGKSPAAYMGTLQSQTFTIPLNDADVEQQTPRKRGRPRKSAGGSISQKRQATPARPRATSSSRKRTATPEAELESMQSTPKRKRGRPRKSEASSPSQKSPRKVGSKISDIEAAEDEYEDGFQSLKADEDYGAEDSHVGNQSRPSYPSILPSVTNSSRSQISPSRQTAGSSPRKDPQIFRRYAQLYHEDSSLAENDIEPLYPTIHVAESTSYSQTAKRNTSPSTQATRKSLQNSPHATSTPLVKRWTQLNPSQGEEITHRSRARYSKSPQIQDEAKLEEQEAGVEIEEQSVTGESNVDVMDVDMDMDMDDDVEPIGDETMAKSMDMTMVSLSAVENWNPEPKPLEPSISPPQSRSASRNRRSSRGSSNPPSSPHVHFSSPLVTPTPPHIRANAEDHTSSVQRQSIRSPVAQTSSVRLIPNPRHLPTPDSDDRDENNELLPLNSTPKSAASSSQGSKTKIVESQEQKWARERQENIRRAQTASASQTVKIEDNIEDDNEDIEEVERNLDQLESEADVWQAVADSSPQFPANNSYTMARPSVANYRESRQSYVEVTTNSPEPESIAEQIDFIENEEEENVERDDQSVISALFRSQRFRRKTDGNKVAAQGKARAEPESDDSMMSGEDLSSLLRRKVANVLGNFDFSMLGENEFDDEVEKTEHDRVSEESSTQRSINASAPENNSRMGRLAVPLSHSPKKSSPLKRRLDIEEVETDEDDEDSNRASKRQMSESQMQHSRTPKRPVRPSLLKVTQERRARQSFNSPPRRPVKPSPQASTGTSKGIFNKVMSYITPWQEPAGHQSPSIPPPSSLPDSVSQKRPAVQTRPVWPPSRPTHPLLTHFRLLPSSHPWTDNHFRALLSLYRHWLSHEQLYSPSIPANAKLLSSNPAWLSYADMELSNWGYELCLTPSLVVLGAIFKELCVLDGGSEEYIRLYPEEGGLDLGTVGSRTESEGKITEWHVVLRLFTTIVGDLVRVDEGKGAKVDRKPGLRWRWKGGWVWRRGWVGGLF